MLESLVAQNFPLVQSIWTEIVKLQGAVRTGCLEEQPVQSSIHVLSLLVENATYFGTIIRHLCHIKSISKFMTH